MIKEYLLRKITGKSRYQRSKKAWFNKRVYKFTTGEPKQYQGSTISYIKDKGRTLTYYGSRSSVSQQIEFFYKKSTPDCFFLSKYESMLKNSNISFDYELVVDYEKKIFDELTTEDKRQRSLEKLGI